MRFGFRSRSGSDPAARVGGEVVVRLRGDQTRGACIVLERRLAPGARLTMQRSREDKELVLLEGEVDLPLSSGVWHLTRGQWALVPRLTTHGLVNSGKTPARLLEIVWTGRAADGTRPMPPPTRRKP